ncbi:MAG: alpha/beta hydrolase [Actinomycetota bacterium]|nr:alpha/beta hydrolase [Actinomycetota bacterium]
MPEITINGHEVFYREQGSGSVALFVHGFPLDSTMWLEQLDALSDVRRCIAPDLRGFGRSAPSVRPVLTMEDHAFDLVALIDALGVERVDLIGLSMGGYVALAFAERYPERLRTLALVDTKSTEDSVDAKAGRDAASDRVAAEGRSGLATDMVGVLVAESASSWTRARLRTMIEATPAEAIVGALKGMKQRPDRTTALSSLTIPVAVIVGENDVLSPIAEADHMAVAAGAALTVVPDAGHMTPIEDPAAVTDALRSLWSLGQSE